jgi:hypothetical protein
MRVFALLSLAAGASGSLLRTAMQEKMKAAGPGNVYLSDTQIYGAGVDGAADLDICNDVPKGLVKSSTEPRFKVCGQSIKVSLFLLNDCSDYKKVEIGHCDTTLAADACHEIGPGADMAPAGMQHFQSYRIESCGK